MVTHWFVFFNELHRYVNEACTIGSLICQYFWIVIKTMQMYIHIYVDATLDRGTMRISTDFRSCPTTDISAVAANRKKKKKQNQWTRLTYFRVDCSSRKVFEWLLSIIIYPCLVERTILLHKIYYRNEPLLRTTFSCPIVLVVYFYRPCRTHLCRRTRF